MKYGYIRVADVGPTAEEQTTLLLRHDCDRLYTDVTKDSNSSQDALHDLLHQIKSGDTLVLYDLSRLDKPLKDVVFQLTNLLDQQIGVVSLKDQIDTARMKTADLKCLLFALLSFEVKRTSEKNKIGLRSARARGKLGGRPKKLDHSKIAMVKSLHRDKKHSIDDICSILKISRATFYRYLK